MQQGQGGQPAQRAGQPAIAQPARLPGVAAAVECMRDFMVTHSLTRRGSIRGLHMTPDAAAQAQVLRRTGHMRAQMFEIGLPPAQGIGVGVLAGRRGGQQRQRVATLPFSQRGA